MFRKSYCRVLSAWLKSTSLELEILWLYKLLLMKIDTVTYRVDSARYVNDISRSVFFLFNRILAKEAVRWDEETSF